MYDCNGIRVYLYVVYYVLLSYHAYLHKNRLRFVSDLVVVS